MKLFLNIRPCCGKDLLLASILNWAKEINGTICSKTEETFVLPICLMCASRPVSVTNGGRSEACHYWIINGELIIQRVIGPICCLCKKHIVFLASHSFIFCLWLLYFVGGQTTKCLKAQKVHIVSVECILTILLFAFQIYLEDHCCE